MVAGVSVGIVDGEILVDLTYEEDSRAQVDMNVCMNSDLELVEIQGTAEGRAFPSESLQRMVKTCKDAVSHIMETQKHALQIE
jgi:ribonuclease PH